MVDLAIEQSAAKRIAQQRPGKDVVHLRVRPRQRNPAPSALPQAGSEPLQLGERRKANRQAQAVTPPDAGAIGMRQLGNAKEGRVTL